MTNEVDALGELASVIDRLSKQLDDMDKEDEQKGMKDKKLDFPDIEAVTEIEEKLWKKHLKTWTKTMTIDLWANQRNLWKN